MKQAVQTVVPNFEMAPLQEELYRNGSRPHHETSLDTARFSPSEVSSRLEGLFLLQRERALKSYLEHIEDLEQQITLLREFVQEGEILRNERGRLVSLHTRVCSPADSFQKTIEEFAKLAKHVTAPHSIAERITERYTRSLALLDRREEEWIQKVRPYIFSNSAALLSENESSSSPLSRYDTAFRACQGWLQSLQISKERAQRRFREGIGATPSTLTSIASPSHPFFEVLCAAASLELTAEPIESFETRNILDRGISKILVSPSKAELLKEITAIDAIQAGNSFHPVTSTTRKIIHTALKDVQSEIRDKAQLLKEASGLSMGQLEPLVACQSREQVEHLLSMIESIRLPSCFKAASRQSARKGKELTPIIGAALPVLLEKGNGAGFLAELSAAFGHAGKLGALPFFDPSRAPQLYFPSNIRDTMNDIHAIVSAPPEQKITLLLARMKTFTADQLLSLASLQPFPALCTDIVSHGFTEGEKLYGAPAYRSKEQIACALGVTPGDPSLTSALQWLEKKGVIRNPGDDFYSLPLEKFRNMHIAALLAPLATIFSLAGTIITEAPAQASEVPSPPPPQKEKLPQRVQQAADLIASLERLKGTEETRDLFCLAYKWAAVERELFTFLSDIQHQYCFEKYAARNSGFITEEMRKAVTWVNQHYGTVISQLSSKYGPKRASLEFSKKVLEPIDRRIMSTGKLVHYALRELKEFLASHPEYSGQIHTTISPQGLSDFIERTKPFDTKRFKAIIPSAVLPAYGTFFGEGGGFYRTTHLLGTLVKGSCGGEGGAV